MPEGLLAEAELTRFPPEAALGSEETPKAALFEDRSAGSRRTSERRRRGNGRAHMPASHQIPTSAPTHDTYLRIRSMG
jgi:hypothetical protein